MIMTLAEPKPRKFETRTYYRLRGTQGWHPGAVYFTDKDEHDKAEAGLAAMLRLAKPINAASGGVSADWRIVTAPVDFKQTVIFP